uniref:Uncharacterized protein n=1 Tax=Timema bartmani TaxID=61472 RepID=A0A7R9EVY9_9NEOP|nr:unnamed protein product [Timema bartmani]
MSIVCYVQYSVDWEIGIQIPNGCKGKCAVRLCEQADEIFVRLRSMNMENDQDVFLQSLISSHDVMQHRPRKQGEGARAAHGKSFTYSVMVGEHKEQILASDGVLLTTLPTTISLVPPTITPPLSVGPVTTEEDLGIGGGDGSSGSDPAAIEALHCVLVDEGQPKAASLLEGGPNGPTEQSVHVQSTRMSAPWDVPVRGTPPRTSLQDPPKRDKQNKEVAELVFYLNNFYSSIAKSVYLCCSSVEQDVKPLIGHYLLWTVPLCGDCASLHSDLHLPRL